MLGFGRRKVLHVDNGEGMPLDVRDFTAWTGYDAIREDLSDWIGYLETRRDDERALRVSPSGTIWAGSASGHARAFRLKRDDGRWIGGGVR